MSNEIKGGGNHELSTDINVITAEINAYQRVAGEAIFEIGRRLKHVRDNDLAYGEFGKWLGEVGIDRTLATRLMKIAEEFEGDYATWHKLPMRALYEIATLPPEAREIEHEVNGKRKKPEEMTVRELREVKRQLKAEQERVERLEKEKDAERSERERLEDELEKAPKIEVRTEYIEVKDEVAERKLSRYEELFGDVSMYEGKTTPHDYE